MYYSDKSESKARGGVYFQVSCCVASNISGKILNQISYIGQMFCLFIMLTIRVY